MRGQHATCRGWQTLPWVQVDQYKTDQMAVGGGGGSINNYIIRKDFYLDMFKFKHVTLNESVSNFLVCPSDEQFIIMIRLQKK